MPPAGQDLALRNAIAAEPICDDLLAAHAVAARVVDLCGVFTFGFSAAATARVGHAIGSGSPAQASRSAWVAVQLSTIVGLGAAAVLVLAPTAIVGAVLGDADPADIEAAAALLSIAAGLLVLESIQSAAGGALSARLRSHEAGSCLRLG